jgi:hypothetical protein
MPIQGSFQDMSVLEAIQLIGTQRKTATLKVDLTGDEVQLHFREGQLVASHRRAVGRGEPFLDAMVALAHLSPAEAMRIGQQVLENDRDLWTAVCEVPHLEQETCERVYMQVTEAVVDRALLCERGYFAVLPAFRVTPVFSPPLSVDSILLDAMRRLDELASWKQRDFPPGCVPCLTGPEELYVSADPLRRAVVRQIDGRRTTAQVVEATRLGEYEVFTVLAEGLDAGWIQVLAPSFKNVTPMTPTRKAFQRWPAVVVFAALLLVTASLSWVGHRLEPVSSPWAKTQAYWEEPDLRRLIETYRYRHGSYPRQLQDLADRGLPVAPSTLGRWQYSRAGRSYSLTLR